MSTNVSTETVWFLDTGKDGRVVALSPALSSLVALPAQPRPWTILLGFAPSVAALFQAAHDELVRTRLRRDWPGLQVHSAVLNVSVKVELGPLSDGGCRITLVPIKAVVNVCDAEAALLASCASEALVLLPLSETPWQSPIQSVNRSALELIARPGLAHGQPFESLFPRRADLVALRPLLDAASRSESATAEVFLAFASGRSFWCEVIVKSVCQGEHQGIVWSFRDITRRRRALDQLAAERVRLAVTLRAIGHAVLCTDANGRISFANEEACRLLCRSENSIMGQVIGDILVLRTPSGIIDPLREVLRSGRSYRSPGKVRLEQADADPLSLLCSASPVHVDGGHLSGVVFVLVDLTGLDRAEQDTHVERQIESLSLLAGSIAHDFNNLLTGLLGSLSLARALAPQGSDLADLLASAERACVRASDLSGQLRSFARGVTPRRVPVNVTALLQEAADFILRGTPSSCEILAPEDLWPVLADETQLIQVFHNLFLNAIQAMPSGGTITVELANCALPPNAVQGLVPGPYLRFVFTDSGPGIPPEVLPRIFEPYFTTKATGNGLGLASTYSIIRNHQGSITVRSEPENGAAFTILLPASIDPVATPQATRRISTPPFRPRRRGRVLVLDDEELVRGIAADMLAHLGFEPSVAASPDEFLTACRAALESGRPFDVALLDLTLPGGTGARELIQPVRRIDPNLKVVVCTGHLGDPSVLEPASFGFSAAIVKPFTLVQLERVLSTVLG